jgi:hypothetical protein
MIVRLLKTCVLGRAGVLLNLPLGRSHDLIRGNVAEEFAVEQDYERKVISPENKEQPKKRGRPRKNPS